jgi:hypothetical protein
MVEPFLLLRLLQQALVEFYGSTVQNSHISAWNFFSALKI